MIRIDLDKRAALEFRDGIAECARLVNENEPSSEAHHDTPVE